MARKHIIEFYGSTCPYCREIEPAVDRLQREDGATVERLEVWNNARNAEQMEALADLYEAECGGNMVVPSFYDPMTGRLICNPGSYERLKEWVEG